MSAQSEFTVQPAVLRENAVVFGRLLRRVGLPVDPERTRQFAQAMLLVGLGRKRDLKAAGRAIFTRRREEQLVFDVAFELFWKRRVEVPAVPLALPRMRQEERPRHAAGPALPGEEARMVDRPAPAPVVGDATDAEALRHADFASLSAAEARDALAMLDALIPALPRRRTRRDDLGAHGRRPAMRRMLRRALATGGEPLTWRWLRRRTRPRPIVLVCDISGSMERYSRFLLRFAHALQRAGAPLEVFVFGTRLTRITRHLRVSNADVALRRVADLVVDWSGGTRIGASIRTLNRDWVRRTIRSGAVVLIVSDGWERGDVTQLGREMALLRRSCHRLFWLDPLASRPGFEPATAGLLAALPHADALIPCADVASLVQLAARLRALSGRDAPAREGAASLPRAAR